jgi:hypothetical protein
MPLPITELIIRAVRLQRPMVRTKAVVWWEIVGGVEVVSGICFVARRFQKPSCLQASFC